MQLFPFTLCSLHGRAGMAVPCMSMLVLSTLYCYLFLFSGPPKRHQRHRTGFHFQPANFWMNDPNGPMFYKGFYHLFYQWNPYATVWGKISWGHAVSKDLINWRHLQVALEPDQWYDMYGCWSGSATFTKDGKPVLVYTGWSNASSSRDRKVQTQALAMPADEQDPLLRNWTKSPQNPIITAPQGIDSNFFRDPTTAWIGADGKWRMLIGSEENHTGLALLYRSSDFLIWEKASAPLHSVTSTGMWECPDFYPVSLLSKGGGLNTSSHGEDVMHVLKVSCVHDYYAVGTYVASNDTFFPVQANLDAGIGLRYDYGKYYASKSFYDGQKNRRILFGWVNESDTEEADTAKGWASLQAFPRVVWLDSDTNYSLRQWPIEELESLHRAEVHLENISLENGAIIQVKGIKGAQLDIYADFELPEGMQSEMMDVSTLNAQLACSERGASRHGVFGPFGLLVLASEDRVEQTAIFFIIIQTEDGWNAIVCSDQSRSSLNSNLDKTSYGNVHILQQRQTLLSLRILVDHSIVETFALGGRICLTCRVYPVKAINEAAHLFVFNNGTVPVVLKELKAWELANAIFHSLGS